MVTTTRYIYDGNQYLAEADETDAINRLYTNEPDTYTHLISQEEVSTGETLTYHYDAIGSTRTVTDETETVTDEFTYDAWGNRLSRTGANDIPFQYVGEHGYYREEATDSYYVMARTYQPSVGRWWSVDPLGFFDGVNLFLYSINSPLGNVDPSGLRLARAKIGIGVGEIGDILKRRIIRAAAAACKKWHDEEMKDLSWLDKLPECPCYVCEIAPSDRDQWTPPEKASSKYHPGADECFRSKPKWSPRPGPGQQCCYKDSQLITSGPAAGTPDRFGPGFFNKDVLWHKEHDVDPYEICEMAGRTDLYLEARPPNKGNDCDSFPSPFN